MEKSLKECLDAVAPQKDKITTIRKKYPWYTPVIKHMKQEMHKTETLA